MESNAVTPLLYVICNFVSLHVTKVIVKNCQGQEEGMLEIWSHSVLTVSEPVCTNGHILTGKFCSYIKSLFLKALSPIPPKHLMLKVKERHLEMFMQIGQGQGNMRPEELINKD